MNSTGMEGNETGHKPIVHAKDGHAVTTSEALSQSFGVSPVVVSETIKRLMAQFPELVQFHITPISSTDRGGAASLFELDREGFALLAISLCEGQQVELKLHYLREFEAVESEFDYEIDLIDVGRNSHIRDWPLEELRAKRGVADLYRMVFGTSAAQWAMQELGFPCPPQKLIALGRQTEIPLDGLPPHATAA